jgi:hypothetical protein
VVSGIETLPYYSLVQLSARRHKVAVQHVVGARAVGRHPRAMHHLPPVPGQDEARHKADDRAMWAQRWQVEEPPLRLPWVLLHKTTKTPGLVAVIEVRLVPHIICATAATSCQAAVLIIRNRVFIR